MTYADKLRDPRWQKKRLKILERDKWECRSCGDSENELQIHHLRYNGNPWDAKDADLLTVCDSCHTSMQYGVNTIKDAMVHIQRERGAEGIDEAERIMTMLSKLDPYEMLSIRKMISCKPDYEALFKMFKHG